jgi:hypothetical protein
MFYHKKTKTYINEGQAFTLSDIQYPSNWLMLSSPEDKTALGLTEVTTKDARKDDKYFWVSEELNGAVKTIVNTPKSTEMIDAMHKSEVDVKLTKLREVRENILNRLSGIALRAQIEADTATIEAYKTTVAGLLDLTTGVPADPREFDAFIRKKYYIISSTAIASAPNLAKVFPDTIVG